MTSSALNYQEISKVLFPLLAGEKNANAVADGNPIYEVTSGAPSHLIYLEARYFEPTTQSPDANKTLTALHDAGIVKHIKSITSREGEVKPHTFSQITIDTQQEGFEQKFAKLLAPHHNKIVEQLQETIRQQHEATLKTLQTLTALDPHAAAASLGETQASLIPPRDTLLDSIKQLPHAAQADARQQLAGISSVVRTR